MITAVANVATYLQSELLLDANGDPVTDKTDDDWTKSARLVGSATTITPTVEHDADGDYDILATFTAVGTWRVSVSVVVDSVTRRFGQTVQVITPAQFDPAAALAETVSAVSALTERLTTTRAAKLDRIGSNAEIVTAGTLTDGDRLDIRRGDSYLAADNNSKQWTYTGPAIASATLTLRTYAGATVLTKAVTLSGSTLTAADITTIETAAMSKGTPIYRYEIVAALTAGGTSTLVSGAVWVAD